MLLYDQSASTPLCMNLLHLLLLQSSRCLQCHHVPPEHLEHPTIKHAYCLYVCTLYFTKCALLHP